MVNIERRKLGKFYIEFTDSANKRIGENKMAKLVVGSLVTWLMVAVCTIRLTHAGSPNPVTKAQLERISRTPCRQMTDSDWKTLTESSEAVLSGRSDIMDIDEALSAMTKCPASKPKDQNRYTRIYADGLIDMKKINCNHESRLSELDRKSVV